MKWIILFLLTWASDAMGSELLNIINKERQARKLPLLTEKSELVCAATKHSKDIGARKACTHTGRDGSDPGKRLSSCGMSAMAWGEIVACGQRTPRAAVDAWIKSPGHNAIMFSKNWKYFGDGMANNYWTVVFTK